MLKARAFREGVELNEDVLHFLATRIKSNFRELEGALISLIANATLAHKEITVELAESITEKIVGEQQNDVTIDKVQKVVCDYFNITRDDLLSKTRKRQIVQARQIAMYLCKQHTKSPLTVIGSSIGGRNHATVLHSCKAVADMIDTDKQFKAQMEEIEKLVLSK